MATEFSDRVRHECATSNADPLDVTVVIATHNMGQYVSEAIDSVLQQVQFQPTVVVVDDGSTDNTQEVLSKYRDNSRVTIVIQSNQGQPRAKNAGLRAANGSFIAFCDADDYWLPDKLQRQMPLFSDPRVGVVYSPAVQLFEDGSTKQTASDNLARGYILDSLFLHNFVPFGTAVVRRECFARSGLFDESRQMGIDWELWLRLAQEWKFDYVDLPTYVYRIWPGQMSHNWRGRHESTMSIMRTFLARCPETLDQSIVARAYADTYVNYALLQIEHGQYSSAVRSLGLAIRHDAQFVPAWKLSLRMPWLSLRNVFRTGR